MGKSNRKLDPLADRLLSYAWRFGERPTDSKDDVRGQQLIGELREYLKDVHVGILGVPIQQGEHSQAIDKKSIFLRLKDDEGNFYSKEYLAHVFLHCYAFTISEGFGHNKDWLQTYRALLCRAEALGIRLDTSYKYLGDMR